MNTLSTIGYEASSIDDFIATLSAAKIKTLIDVRQVAGSRRKGFAKTALSTALNGAGIKYIHLRGLGDPKDGRIAAREGRFDDFLKIFSAHMATNDFMHDLREAMEIVDQGSACLMCYERDHNFCHRKLVADSISDISNVVINHLGVRKDIAKNDRKVRNRANSHIGESTTAC